MDKKGWLVIAIAVAIVLSYFSWTWFLSPEARVKRTIDAAVAAAEQVDAPAFLSFIASDYSDYLHADRATFVERVEAGFDRVDRLNITVQAMEVVVEDEEAAARFELVVVAFRGEDRFVAVGTPFQPELIAATLRRDASGWKLVRVEQGIARR